MVEIGDPAPDIHAPVVGSEIKPFRLSDAIGDGPIVLAFFPGAFTSTCTAEMCTFRDEMAQFDSIGAIVYGLSVDTPFSLREYRDKHDLQFGLISDHEKHAIDAYDVRKSYDDIGFEGVARRSVFIIDDAGRIAYKWVAEKGGVEPDYEEIETAAAEAAEAVS